MHHEIMAVDRNEELVNEVLPYTNSALIADSTDGHFLESLGVRNFDACIVAIGDDFQSSLETTLRLRELGAKYIVARASSSIHEKFLLRNGADEVVYPDEAAGPLDGHPLWLGPSARLLRAQQELRHL